MAPFMSEKDIHRLQFEDKEILLVGTAHVSLESAELVEEIIREERPDTVSVELCRARYQALTDEGRWRNTDLVDVIRQKKAFLLLSNLILAYFQRKIGNRLGIRPGEEIRRAVAAAREAGAQVHLADRDIRITLARTWRRMGFLAKLRLLGQLISSSGELESIDREDVERLKRMDVLETVLTEVGRSFPEIKETLIDERDLYLAHRIRTAPGRKIVAVVGAGHVPGILEAWERPVDIEALETIPPKGRGMRVVKWGLPLLILALIALGFVKAGTATGTHMIRWWVLANGVLAGLGAALALAHPLSILSAVAAAPLTSLNPMIAAGWVSGLVEALLKKPKVRDFESLPEDIGSLKGFWRNRITRVLLVVVFTNIGSSVGTFVAIPIMMRLLA
ncbi:MAG: TraB/GumN family protein [Thermodesulfobacteriota bacterium]|nr:TraB/GumN family protein [Thermodesulfobacteriota bacterium]